MKRSEINQALADALRCFKAAHWALPPQPRWDVTDFGLGKFAEIGLVLVNLAEQPEYCEKLMYAKHHQVLPMHTHQRKKEDIICRHGRLSVELWKGHPEHARAGEVFSRGDEFSLCRDGGAVEVRSGEPFIIEAGERVTIEPGVYHAFWPESKEAVIGEVSTVNDDAHDNFFVDPRIGRFPEIEEDAPPVTRLFWETIV
jgi:D-lyxose ketol-isomerase